jgi:4-hydroxy-3-polyprenylbenzoate decarboxylase
MDVLDHSCSKLGFGGKLFIDGSVKMDEESDPGYAFPILSKQYEKSRVMQQYPEIKAINDALPAIHIPCLIISVEKNRTGHVRDLHQQLCASGVIEGIKMVLYVEHTVNANDLPVALWRFCNNLDPRRDSILVQQPGKQMPGTTWACMGFDGTLKNKELDGFQRDWPNIIVADDATIASVDKKWNQLGLGALVPSPSLKFKDQVYGSEAVAK